VRVSLKGIKGVEKVEVSLNKGLANIQLTPGNAVTIKQLLDAIAKNGFVTKQSLVIAVGDLIQDKLGARLRIIGSNETFAVIADEGMLKPLLGRRVLLEGVVPEVQKGRVAGQIQVKSIAEESK
jgi:copper chaperone CopZ